MSDFYVWKIEIISPERSFCGNVPVDNVDKPVHNLVYAVDRLWIICRNGILFTTALFLHKSL
jgi:hypothetical protein